MKIVRVIARLNVGGPAKHVVWLSKLGAPDYQSLLVAGTVPPGEDDMSYFASEMGVEPLYLPEMSREISVKDAITVWKLYRLFVREQPEIIHTHTAKAGTVGRVAGLMYRWLTPSALLARPRKCHVVHTYHGHIFHSYYGRAKTRLFLLIEKVLAKVATDRIVVLSEQQHREINRQFKVGRAEQFSVVPLGLDLNVFSDWERRGSLVRSEFGIGGNDILVGIVGRLTEVKNHELFLRAAAEFKKKYSFPDKKIIFIIVGDGTLRSNLEHRAQSLGLETDVIFTGTRKDLDEVYPAFDIVALTSRNEGTPLTLIEAMANARAVISTAVGGVVDLLGAPLPDKSADNFTICERGISVAPGDVSALVDGLHRLITDPQLRRDLGMRGSQFVNANYSRQRLLRDIKALYADLLKAA